MITSQKFTGYKLLELRYYDCEPESQIINFKYPYTEEKQYDCNFNVKMFINNPIFFNTVIRLLYEYSGPVLIYGLLETSWHGTSWYS